MKASKKESPSKLAKKLSDACGRNNLHEVKALLADGAKPDGFMDSEGAPLSEAVNVGGSRIVKLLLDAGADANLQGPFNGRTPLALACLQGRIGIAEILFSKGADIDKGEALFFSISHNQPKSVKFLLERGAKVDATLLHRAAMMQNALEIVGMLVSAGADVNHSDLDSSDDPSLRGRVPLHLAGNNPKLTKLLLSAGADPNRQYHLSKRTPLFVAARRGNIEVAQMLLNAGANVNHVDAEGKTAEQIAKKHGHPKLAEFLKRFAKAELSARGRQERQPTKGKALKAPRLPPVVKHTEIGVPRLSGSALRFATGLSDFVSDVDERGGAFGLIAVESSLKEVVSVYSGSRVREMRTDIQISASKKADAISNRWIPLVQPTGTRWTIIYRHIWFNLDGVDEMIQKEAGTFSSELRARALALLANSDGAVCHLLYKGTLVGVNSETRVEKANRLLKWLQVYIPACHATEEEQNGVEVIRLAVCPSSSGRVAAAAALLPSN